GQTVGRVVALMALVAGRGSPYDTSSEPRSLRYSPISLCLARDSRTAGSSRAETELESWHNTAPSARRATNRTPRSRDTERGRAPGRDLVPDRRGRLAPSNPVPGPRPGRIGGTACGNRPRRDRLVPSRASPTG